ncbi:Protein CBG15576 [Caenorhabditis briggsae]|uniref:Elongin-C n=1 Tax=Caenorhabditis briggsae TaxID=6238 RepID=A8XM41_CAEBR|nr:Protein CBG15576 [Caenorhabditis briggsae]CAP33716.2 Protein CBG15576 [Caenorhabditis briggsae]
MENEEIEKLKETSEAPARMDGSEKGDGIEESDSSRVYCDHKPSAPPQTCKKKIFYPGLNGNNSVYVKLVSRENDEFVIRRSRAEKSKTIRDMLQGPNAGTDNTVYLHMVSSKCVKALCCYLNWQYEYLKKKGEYEAFYIAPEDSMDLFFMSAYLEL